MTRTWARRLLIGLAALAGVELAAGALVYRDTIDQADWDALAQALESDESDSVRLATGWLGPRARMEVPSLAQPDSAAAPDLHGIETLTVVGLGEAWSDALDRELEGSLRPDRVALERNGPFTLARYRFEQAPRTLVDWVTQPPALSTPQGACQGRTSSWRCKEGTVKLAFAEVDYTARRCFTFALSGGTPLRFHASDMPLGTALRGHVGVTDFNGRLRSDAPIRVEARIDGQSQGHFTVTDAQGWRPFVIPTTGGTHDVEVVLTDTVQGTWGREGLKPGDGRKVCFELRALDGGQR